MRMVEDTYFSPVTTEKVKDSLDHEGLGEMHYLLRKCF